MTMMPIIPHYEPPVQTFATMTLPRYVKFKGDNGNYLKLHYKDDHPYLCFNSGNELDQITTHEVFPVADNEGVVRIKSLGAGKWWTSSRITPCIWADQIPSKSDKDCMFKVNPVSSTRVVLQNLGNGKLLNYVQNARTDGLWNVLQTTAGDHGTPMEFIEVVDFEKAPTLPRYVMFKSCHNHNYLSPILLGIRIHLCFKTGNGGYNASHEVFPVPNQVGVVSIKALDRGFWWNLSPSWIWAERLTNPSASDKNCLFKIHKLDDTRVALENLGNNKFVRILDEDGKKQALNACAGDARHVTAQMEVSAASSRTLSDVEYLWHLARTLEEKSVHIGEDFTLSNTGSHMADVATEMTLETEETNTWNTSVSFTLETSVGFSLGKPDVASVSVTKSDSKAQTWEWGKANTTKTSVRNSVTVKDVPPGTEAMITATATRVQKIVPFIYKYEETLRNNQLLVGENGQAKQVAYDGEYIDIQFCNKKIIASDGLKIEVKQIEVKKI